MGYRVAPIIAYMRHWSLEKILDYTQQKGWKVTMRIKIIERGSIESKKSAKGTTYSLFNLKYESDGKARDRKIMSFDKETYAILKNATENEQYEVNLVKNGEFWDWKEIKKAEAANDAQGGGSASKPAAKGNWETSEERAMRQVYIARQSSLAQAVNYHASRGDAPIEQILDTAQQFVDFVFSDVEETEEEPTID